MASQAMPNAELRMQNYCVCRQTLMKTEDLRMNNGGEKASERKLSFSYFIIQNVQLCLLSARRFAYGFCMNHRMLCTGCRR